MTHEEPDFVEGLGPAFAAHLLRRISDELVEVDKLWHTERGVENPPRTSSTLLALDERGPMSITGLAGLLRQSHQLVQQWVRELRSRGLVEIGPDPADGRRSIVSLTSEGSQQVDVLRRSLEPLEKATAALLEDVAPGLYGALWKLERRLRHEPLIARIREADGKN